MSRRNRLISGAVSVLAVSLCAPAALALDESSSAAFAAEEPTPTPDPTSTPSPTPTSTPSAPLLPVAPDPTRTPTPTPAAVTAEPAGDDIDPRFLPDLRLGGVADLRLVRTAEKRLQLRFSSTLLNYGTHEMKVRAKRDKPRGKFAVAQRVRLMNGHWTWRMLPIGTVYAGDGHSHQHLRDIVRYRMYLVDADGNRVEEDKRRARKIGFCIYDNVRRPAREGQPKRPVFLRSGCGKKTSTRLSMGLSVGWGDFYDWRLPGQYVSLGGLPTGTYTLIGEANPEGVLYEQKTTNNGVFMEFKLRRGEKTSIKVLRKGFRPAEKAVVDVSSHDGHPAHPEGDGHDDEASLPPVPATTAGTQQHRTGRGRRKSS